MTRKARFHGMLAAGLLALPACAASADAPSGAAPATLPATITVRGDATLSRPPNEAHVPVTVRAEKSGIAEAKAQHDNMLHAVLDLAAKRHIAPEKMHPSYTSINPLYDYSAKDNTPHLRGYEAQTTLDVTLDDASNVAGFVQDAVALGLDRIGNVEYTLSNEAALKDDALVLALQHAHAKALRLAETAQQRLGEPMHIEATGESAAFSPPRPRMAMMAMKAEAAPPETPTGLVEVREDVTVTYLITPLHP